MTNAIVIIYTDAIKDHNMFMIFKVVFELFFKKSLFYLTWQEV